MIKVKKRMKATRFRGTHTHGRGFKKKARGKGHRGGVGMAGTGKKADQKKTLILNLPYEYFGTKPRLAGRTPKNIEVIDLKKVVENIDAHIRRGTAKEIKGGYELNLGEKKVLCTGELKVKLMIKAGSASNSATEKVKNAGGSIEINEKASKSEREEKKE